MSELLGLLKRFAYAKREVTLASGQKSDVYIDCKQILFRGDAQLLIGQQFSLLLQECESSRRVSFAACGGMALGAVPLCAALSMTMMQQGRHLPGVIVRKESKAHGTAANIEGASCVPAGSAIILLEDVVTTGGSTLLAAQRLREASYKVDTVLALVDRLAGGRENLQKEGLCLHALFDLRSFRD